MPSLTEDLRHALEAAPPDWNEVVAAEKLSSAMTGSKLFAGMFRMPLLREDNRRIRAAEQVLARRNRFLNLSPTSGDWAGDEFDRRMDAMGVDVFVARLWDRKGPTYRFLASLLGTRPNPSAAEHPEETAKYAAAFEGEEVIDEREAETGQQILSELKPAIDYFGSVMSCPPELDSTGKAPSRGC